MTVIGHGYDDNVGAPAFRNVIINGGMNVTQRNTSVPSITGTNYYTVDRWNTNISTLGTWTQSIENDAPTGSGHRKSLKMLCTTAKASPSAGDYALIDQTIEGQNLQHFCKGTSSTKSITLSFWVKANVTGTYTLFLQDYNNSRSISASYNISASATWEKKTITFSGDTSGVIASDNAAGIGLRFMLAAGSSWTSGTLGTSWNTLTLANLAVGQVNLASATNNYWQITGVQLEAGPVATPFEFEPFETTLRKCQRYYQIYDTVSDSWTTTMIRDSSFGTGALYGGFFFQQTMRTTPTTTFGNPSSSSTLYPTNTTASVISASHIALTSGGAYAAGYVVCFRGKITLNAEL